MKTYKVYVTDDNGWIDGCPDSEGVFFGSTEHGGKYVHPAHGGTNPAGHVEITGYRATLALLHRLRTSGDWIAPEEINPDGEVSRPTYAMAELADASEADTEISAAQAEWPEDAIREYIESHDENDTTPEDQLVAMFRSVYGRSPEGREERLDMWSHICAGVSHA